MGFNLSVYTCPDIQVKPTRMIYIERISTYTTYLFFFYYYEIGVFYAVYGFGSMLFYLTVLHHINYGRRNHQHEN